MEMVIVVALNHIVTFSKPPFPDDYPQNASRNIYLLGLV
jgi:hypothetical protein